MTRFESTIRDFALLDRIAQQSTWVHRLDPRAKILTTLCFVTVVASYPSHTVMGLLPFAIFPLLLLIGGRISPRILWRPLLMGLLLAFCIGAANPWLDREAVLLTRGIAVSGGWLSLASIILRCVLCVTVAIVLVASSGMPRLCHGLACLGVPRILVTQLLFLYRYAFLLFDNAHAMLQARELRSTGRPLQLNTFTTLSGHLFLHTLDRADRIYQAMRCRGFRGDMPVSRPWKFTRFDAVYLITSCLAMAALRYGWSQDVFGLRS